MGGSRSCLSPHSSLQFTLPSSSSMQDPGTGDTAACRGDSATVPEEPACGCPEKDQKGEHRPDHTGHPDAVSLCLPAGWWLSRDAVCLVQHVPECPANVSVANLGTCMVRGTMKPCLPSRHPGLRPSFTCLRKEMLDQVSSVKP